MEWMKIVAPLLLLAIGTVAFYEFREIERIKETTVPEKYLELRFKHHRDMINDHEQRIRKIEKKQ